MLESLFHRQLDAMDRRRKARDKQTLLGARKNLFESGPHRPFARRIAPPLHVRRVLKQRQYALLAVLRKGMQIEKAVVGGRRINLKVAGVDQNSQRRVN